MKTRKDCCGNGIVEQGENCDTCSLDVKCTSGESCFKSVCTKVSWDCGEWSDCGNDWSKERVCVEKNRVFEDKKEYQNCISHKYLNFNSDVEENYDVGKIKEIENIDNIMPSLKSNFKDGAIINIVRFEGGVYSLSNFYDISIGVYNFDNSDSAKKFALRNKEDIDYGSINKKIETSYNCFAYYEDYGYQVRAGHYSCYEGNKVYWIDTTLQNSIEDIVSEINYFNEIMKDKF